MAFFIFLKGSKPRYAPHSYEKLSDSVDNVIAEIATQDVGINWPAIVVLADISSRPPRLS